MRHDVFTEEWLGEAYKKMWKGKLKGLDAGGVSAAQKMGKPAPSTLQLILYGQLVSGKNQVQLSFKNGKVHKYPNKTFTNWRQRSYSQLLEQVTLVMLRHAIYATPVHLTVDYVPGDQRTRDVSGQLDALFHLLVYAKVLKDDGLVHHVTWRRQPMNRKATQVVMAIEEVKR